MREQDGREASPTAGIIDSQTLLRWARRLFPFIKRIFADGGYTGAKIEIVVSRTGSWVLQIVKRSASAGFEVLPKRWIVGVSRKGTLSCR